MGLHETGSGMSPTLGIPLLAIWLNRQIKAWSSNDPPKTMATCTQSGLTCELPPKHMRWEQGFAAWHGTLGTLGTLSLKEMFDFMDCKALLLFGMFFPCKQVAAASSVTGMCGCSLIVEAASYVSNSPEHNEDVSSPLVLVEPFRRSEVAKVKLFCDGETSRFSRLQGPPAANWTKT